MNSRLARYPNVKSLGGVLCSAVFACVLTASMVPLLSFSSAAGQSKAELAKPLQPLASFAGKWHCEGKFSNGTTISASVSFEPILNGNFLLFRHDDEPPFGYHAWSEWGWDATARQFISTIQDLTGGIRLFRSPGWTEQTLTWTGGNLPDSADQKFVFERRENSKFRVSYSYKKNDSWVAVDSSVCSRVETAPN